jgi:hypothetical protein
MESAVNCGETNGHLIRRRQIKIVSKMSAREK